MEVEVGEFIFAIMMLVVAVLSAFALVREIKGRNFFAVLFSGASLGLFGWYSVMTIYSQLFTG